MKALIDGDIICYSCGFAAQKTVYRVTDKTGFIKFEYKKDAKEYSDKYGGLPIHEIVEAEPVENALHSAKELIRGTCRNVMLQHNIKQIAYDTFLTGDSNFRDERVSYYKANRDRSKKPVHYQAIKDYLLKHHNGRIVQGQEADDAMAQEQWLDMQMVDGHKDHAGTVICTIDKDLDMIPGWHYNWRKEKNYWRSFANAIVFFYTQLLTGDPVDNIKGVPGIGTKRAEKLLKDVSSELQLYRRVQQAYVDYVQQAVDKKAHLPARNGIIAYQEPLEYANEMLQENADLLWIRRVEGEAWVPPTERGKNETTIANSIYVYGPSKLKWSSPNRYIIHTTDTS